MPDSNMGRTTKALVATAALAVGIAAAVIVPKAYKWSRHKEGVMVVQNQEKKEEGPISQVVPVRADAGMEKSPQARSELEEGPVKRRYGRGTGELQGYEEMIKRVRKRLEALEQTP